MDSLRKEIEQQLIDSAKIKDIIREKYTDKILETAQLMINALKAGGKLLLCGNGGSAADSQHFAAEMVGRLKKNRGAIAAIAMTTDTSIITAIGNDYSYDEIFSRQVEALGAPQDVFVGMSTSGNSENVSLAIKAAKAKGIPTVALLGKTGGKLANEADHVIVVPSMISQRIQEGHITIIHIWCDLIEEALFPND